MLEELLAILGRHRGKVLGIFLGFLVGWLVLSQGFFAAFFLLICAAVGYYLGKRADEEGDLQELIERFFPFRSR